LRERERIRRVAPSEPAGLRVCRFSVFRGSPGAEVASYATKYAESRQLPSVKLVREEEGALDDELDGMGARR
jgi:hypothetical protein